MDYIRTGGAVRKDELRAYYFFVVCVLLKKGLESPDRHMTEVTWSKTVKDHPKAQKMVPTSIILNYGFSVLIHLLLVSRVMWLAWHRDHTETVPNTTLISPQVYGDPNLAEIHYVRPTAYSSTTQGKNGEPMCEVDPVESTADYTGLHFNQHGPVVCGPCSKCPSGMTWRPYYHRQIVLTKTYMDSSGDDEYYVMDDVMVPVTCTCQYPPRTTP